MSLADGIERVRIPLTIETELGEFRLEPLSLISDKQSFAVNFKFYNPLTLTLESISDIKNVKEFIKRCCIVLLREVGNGN